MAEAIDGRPALFLTPLYRAEQGVALSVARLGRQGHQTPPWGRLDPGLAIPWVEGRTGLALSESQRPRWPWRSRGKVGGHHRRARGGQDHGGQQHPADPEGQGREVLLCAPTGRAAKRLTESTGLEAKTIHRLLEFDPKVMGFRRDQYSPLEADLVVVDEVSMVDVVLMNQLLRAVPTPAAVLLVGDVDQLPSVGPGCVLADLIGSGASPPRA